MVGWLVSSSSSPSQQQEQATMDDPPPPRICSFSRPVVLLVYSSCSSRSALAVLSTVTSQYTYFEVASTRQYPHSSCALRKEMGGAW